MHRYKRTIAMILMVTAFILITGCKPRETFSEEPPTVTPSIGVQLKLIDNGPVKGGTITLPVTPVDSLNPYFTKDRYVHYMTCLVFESLFIRTGDGQIKPWLAENWGTQDQTVWNFVLKEDIFFHDGSYLSAYDVKYSIEMLQSSQNPFYDMEFCENIQQVNVINSLQLEISLKAPDPSFTGRLTFPILSRKTGNDDSTMISGTGPYQYDSKDETQVKLNRFEKWWPESSANLDTVIFRIYPEYEMLDAFQNHEIDASFVKNADFTKYQHRTDIDYRVYPDNKGNFIYVNPNGLFGQANRQDALFRYISSRLQDMNLGQVQYFDEYSESSLDLDGFRQALIETGLSWNQTQNSFMWGGSSLGTVTIVIPKQDIQKLHTANFLVNILQDAGIKAQIQTVNALNVKGVIRDGGYDLSPMAEELKPWESLEDALQRMQQEMGYGKERSYILPLYRNQQAILYRTNIRGEKNASYWNPYQGIESWYLPILVESSLDD